jgi:mRNA interferase HigB
MTLLGTIHLAAFARKHPDARSALASFQSEVEGAKWSDPAQLKARYPRASFVGKDNVVFDIRGGSYRLHARVNYAMAIFIVVRVGTHAEYDRWTF